MSMREVPTDYWVVQTTRGMIFRVHEDVAKMLDRALTDGIIEVLHFVDTSGASIIWRANEIAGLYECTLDARRHDEEMSKMLKNEEGFTT